MALIEWTDDLNTDIPVIDNQHRRIVDCINKLNHAHLHHSREEVCEVLDDSVVGQVINDLIDYTYSHVAFEEALMEEAGYDALSIHKKTHEAFCTRIDEFKQ